MENEYYIGKLVWGASDKLPITLEKFNQIKSAVQIQMEALYIEQKYDFIVQNYIEFEETLLRAGLQDMILSGQEIQWFHVNRALFDRRIMNLLTTVKSYDDSLEQHFNKIFDRNASKFAEAKAGFSLEYDARLGYRTICKLRNFIQHQGFPVHGSSYQFRWLEDEGVRKGKSRNTVDPYLRPEELRKGDFNRGVLAELEAVGTSVDLKTLVRDFLEGFSIAHHKTREMLQEKLEGAEATIVEAVNSYRSEFGDSKNLLPGLAAISRDGEGDIDDEIFIGQGSNTHRVHLVKKNGSLKNISVSYVSSEIVENTYPRRQSTNQYD